MRRRRREMFITPCTRVRGGGERGGGGRREYISLSPGFQESWICELVRRRRRRRRRRPRPVVRAAYFEGNGGREFSFFSSSPGGKDEEKIVAPAARCGLPTHKSEAGCPVFSPLWASGLREKFLTMREMWEVATVWVSPPQLFFCKKMQMWRDSPPQQQNAAAQLLSSPSRRCIKRRGGGRLVSFSLSLMARMFLHTFPPKNSHFFSSHEEFCQINP